MASGSGSGGAQPRPAPPRPARAGVGRSSPSGRPTLATALDASPATVSSYESLSAPKTPTTARLTAYAQFFATRRSVNGKGPTLRDITSFAPDERERFEQLKAELFDLHAAIGRGSRRLDPSEPKRRQLLQFGGADPSSSSARRHPRLPRPTRDEKSLNHTRLHRFADADALLEVFGHIRALNPDLKVFHRLPSEIQQADLQSHIVLLGGIGWNPTTRRILSHLKEELPIEQIDDKSVPEGDVFRVKKDDDRDERTHLPVIEANGETGERELVEDVGLLARLPNSFNFGRTMTICNGIYSKGVLGAVLAITDETVRPTNEEYLAKRFPQGDFAMLVRVPVVAGHPSRPIYRTRRRDSSNGHLSRRRRSRRSMAPPFTAVTDQRCQSPAAGMSSHVAMTATSRVPGPPSTSAVAGRLDAIIVPLRVARPPSTAPRACRPGSTCRSSPCAARAPRARGGGPTRPYPPMPRPGRRRPTRLPARPAADQDGRPAVPGRQRQPAVRPQPQAQPRAADCPPATAGARSFFWTTTSATASAEPRSACRPVLPVGWPRNWTSARSPASPAASSRTTPWCATPGAWPGTGRTPSCPGRRWR